MSVVHRPLLWSSPTRFSEATALGIEVRRDGTFDTQLAASIKVGVGVDA
jgi:hypothetical protein